MTVIILAGGDAAPTATLPHADAVIAADSGVHHATALQLDVDEVVGDLDSADPATVAASGADVRRHPVDKDATDLELALTRALELGATDAVVVGGEGGRLDHLLANALALAADRWAGMRVRWVTETATVYVVCDEVAVNGAPGDIVTLLPVGGAARSVSTVGLRWALDGDTLLPGTTRGVSNIMTDATARVAVDAGTLLAFHVGGAP